MESPVEYRVELPAFKGDFGAALHRVLAEVRACDYACTALPVPVLRQPAYQSPEQCIVVAVVAEAADYELMHMLARRLADEVESPAALVTETPIDAVAVVTAAPSTMTVQYIA